jgi:hypothetical protein
MTIERVPEGFKLSGGPLIFKSERNLIETCVNLMRFPGMKVQTPPTMKEEFIETMTICDEEEPDAESQTKPG